MERYHAVHAPPTRFRRITMLPDRKPSPLVPKSFFSRFVQSLLIRLPEGRLKCRLFLGFEAGVRGGAHLSRHSSQLHLRGTPLSCHLSLQYVILTSFL